MWVYTSFNLNIPRIPRDRNTSGDIWFQELFNGYVIALYGASIPIFFNSEFVQEFFHEAPLRKRRLEKVGANKEGKP